MEFRHATVCAFFRLKIGQRRAGVEITDILFDEHGLDDWRRRNDSLPPSKARGCGFPLVLSRGKLPSKARPGAGVEASVHAQGSRPVVLDIPLRSRCAKGAMAVGAPDGDRRQRRQCEHARLSSPRHPAVFSRPRLLADRNGADRSRALDVAASRRPTHLREIEVQPSEQTLSGNTVNLEQQMINLGDVNRDYTMTANIRRAFHQLLLSALK